MPQRVLLSVYYSLFHSHLNYCSCIWGFATNALQERVWVFQKKVVRTIANAEMNAHSSPLFKELNTLKFDDVIKMQLGCLMWQYDNGYLPTCFDKYFTKVSNVHNNETRSSSAGKLSQNIAINTSRHGEKMFKFIGPKILNNMKNLKFYKD